MRKTLPSFSILLHGLRCELLKEEWLQTHPDSASEDLAPAVIGYLIKLEHLARQGDNYRGAAAGGGTGEHRAWSTLPLS